MYLNTRISIFLFCCWYSLLMYIFHDKMTLVKLKIMSEKALFYTIQNDAVCLFFLFMHEYIYNAIFIDAKVFCGMFVHEKCQNYFMCM